MVCDIVHYGNQDSLGYSLAVELQRCLPRRPKSTSACSHRPGGGLVLILMRCFRSVAVRRPARPQQMLPFGLAGFASPALSCRGRVARS